LDLDVDTHNGIDGNAEFARWQADRAREGRVLPEHPMYVTASGGRHHWFLLPEGLHVPYNGEWLKNVEVKACGGQVAVPPSTRLTDVPQLESDGNTTWSNEPVPYWWENAVPLPLAPDWLLDDVRTRRDKRVSGRTTTGGGTGSSSEAPTQIFEGDRNIELTRFAGSMRRRGATANEMYPSLWAYNLGHCAPPLPEEEVYKVAQSIATYPTNDPLGQGAGALEVRRASEFVERETEWLWFPRIPFGHLTVLDGDPDLGKSTMTIDFAARATRGWPFPGQDQTMARRPINVLIASTEDTYEEVIVPRLRVAGADLDKVFFFELRRDPVTGHVVPLTIPDDIDRIEAVIVRENIKLFILDPIAAFWSEEVKTYNDPSIRRALAPVADVAERTASAMILIRHLNKSGDAKALYRGGGSIAIVGAARSGLLVAPHPDHPDTVRLLARVKGNLAAPYQAWSFRLAVVEGEGDRLTRVEWIQEETWRTDDILRGHDARKDSPARDEAKAWLMEVLANASLPAKDVKDLATGAGLSWATVKRAATELRVVKTKQTDTAGKIIGWLWSEPVMDFSELIKETGL